MFLKFHGRHFFEDHIEKLRQLEKKWKFRSVVCPDFGSTNQTKPNPTSNAPGQSHSTLLASKYLLVYADLPSCQFVELHVNEEIRTICSEFPTLYHTEHIEEPCEDTLEVLEGFEFGMYYVICCSLSKDCPDFEKPLFTQTPDDILHVMVQMISISKIFVHERTMDVTK